MTSQDYVILLEHSIILYMKVTIQQSEYMVMKNDGKESKKCLALLKLSDRYMYLDTAEHILQICYSMGKFLVLFLVLFLLDFATHTNHKIQHILPVSEDEIKSKKNMSQY